MRVQSVFSFIVVSFVAVASALPVVEMRSDAVAARSEVFEMARGVEVERAVDFAAREPQPGVTSPTWKRGVNEPTWKRGVTEPTWKRGTTEPTW
ncbi:hypothetical protein BT96DRAFT_913124 [Gymnopus androsaceus JB14]|uniref:Uncharacterized protein n=1 Tax=Gymnopus androsaceus JB14 TaxID=1447944 RepID=A0A6A4IG49_9AGAR|nr:hypothetical protein BT96DRAFT_913124 [Gymnopus androsaceus JB14]